MPPNACYVGLTTAAVDLLFGYPGQQHRDVISSLVRQVVDPEEDGLKHCVFSFHIEVVVLDDSSQLLHGELQQLP